MNFLYFLGMGEVRRSLEKRTARLNNNKRNNLGPAPGG
jgi:hypothetical protein